MKRAKSPEIILDRKDGKMRGKVKWFNESKGYGFIERDDGKGDVFVHYSDIANEGFKTLAEGEQVEFELSDSQKGPKASNVKKV